MTDSIKNFAREAQAAHLGEGHDDLVSATEALYDSVDSLTEDQRTLLVYEALRRLSGFMESIATSENPGQRAGFGAVAHAIGALAAYAVQSVREERGFTSTGDAKVNEALDGVRHLLGMFAESQMSPEQRALSEKIRVKVAERVSAGETFEAAMARELAEHEDERQSIEGKVPVAKSQGKESRPDDGLYL